MNTNPPLFTEVEEMSIRRGLVDLMTVAHRINVTNGWWETDRNDGECIALIHSELSEALEALRHNNPPDQHLRHHGSLEVELADAIIRIVDYARGKGLNLTGALMDKLEYNAIREYKHGGKKF